MTNDPDSEHYYRVQLREKADRLRVYRPEIPGHADDLARRSALHLLLFQQDHSTNDLTAPGLTDRPGPNTSPPTTDGRPIPNDIGGYNKLNDYRVYRRHRPPEQGLVVRHAEGRRPGRRLAAPTATTASWTSPTTIRRTTSSPAGRRLTAHQLQAAGKFGLAAGAGLRRLQLASDRQPDDLARASSTWTSRATSTPRTRTSAARSKNQPLFASEHLPVAAVLPDRQLQDPAGLVGLRPVRDQLPDPGAVGRSMSTGVNLQKLQPETPPTTSGHGLHPRQHHRRRRRLRDRRDQPAGRLHHSRFPASAPTAPICNDGKARYSGVEGEAAYTFQFGLTLFANGSLNNAKQLANAANPAPGIAANPAQELANSPKWTDAVGAHLPPRALARRR